MAEVADMPSLDHNQPMYDFTLIVPAGAFGSSVALTLDLLATAAKLAPRVGVARPRWRICGVHAGTVCLAGGLQVDVAALPADATGHECWILPGLDVDDADQLATRLAQPDVPVLAAALRRHVESDGRIASSCSSVFLLNAAGLLGGRTVTTTWWLSTALRRAAPDASVEPDRMVLESGALVTAGAAFAHLDLMLYILRQRFGEALTSAMGQALLVERRRLQSRYALPALMAPESELIARLSALIVQSMPAPVGVADLAVHANMSIRTLNRQVTRLLGHGPQALIQSVRLNRARVLLTDDALSVDEVASRVGLGDATALRRLLRKRLDVTPSQIRG